MKVSSKRNTRESVNFSISALGQCTKFAQKVSVETLEQHMKQCIKLAQSWH